MFVTSLKGHLYWGVSIGGSLIEFPIIVDALAGFPILAVVDLPREYLPSPNLSGFGKKTEITYGRLSCLSLEGNHTINLQLLKKKNFKPKIKITFIFPQAILKKVVIFTKAPMIFCCMKISTCNMSKERLFAFLF